jgi:hypothetical protein
MRERLTLTVPGRRWTIAGIVFMTAAATVMTVLYTVRHDVARVAAAITIVVMIGFPAVAGVYGSRLRRAGEHLAADAVLACTSAAVISMVLIWGIWAIGSISL